LFPFLLHPDGENDEIDEDESVDMMEDNPCNW